MRDKIDLNAVPDCHGDPAAHDLRNRYCRRCPDLTSCGRIVRHVLGNPGDDRGRK